MKKFSDYINEAKQTREEEIVLKTIGGGIKPATISFDTTRNDDKTGKVELEFFSKGPRTYNYFPTPEMLAQLSQLLKLPRTSSKSLLTFSGLPLVDQELLLGPRVKVLQLLPRRQSQAPLFGTPNNSLSIKSSLRQPITMLARLMVAESLFRISTATLCMSLETLLRRWPVAPTFPRRYQ
jgi:hypothetical protein